MRFPEFTGEWEKKQLQEECSFFSGGTPSSSNKEYYDGDIPFIRSGEIDAQHTELFLTQKGYNNSSAKMVEIGDLLLALYGATSGEIAINKIHGAINQAILCIRSPYNNVFVKSIWKKHVLHILQTYLQGGQGNLSADIVKKLSFYFPSNREQDKISEFVALVDQRIETQNKIIEDLKTLKSAISARLFKSNIFDKRIKLSSLGTLKNGYAFQSSTYTIDGQYSILTIANVSGDRYTTNECNHITEIPNDIQQYQILKDNDILISLTGNVGRVSLNTGENNLLNQRVGLFQISDESLREYIYQILATPYFEKSMIAKGQGAAQMNISKSDVEEYEIPYTDDKSLIDKVSYTLYLLDQRIICAQRLASAYSTQKQYLLQQMFI